VYFWLCQAEQVVLLFSKSAVRRVADSANLCVISIKERNVSTFPLFISGCRIVVSDGAVLAKADAFLDFQPDVWS